MVTQVRSCAILGIEAIPIEIEVHIQKGLPCMQIIGLPDLSVKEAKDRVKSAIIHAGYNFPRQKIVVNLAPASIKKVGSLFDLPIALGVLISSKQIKPIKEKTYYIVGELSLNSEVKSIRGAMIIANQALSSKTNSIIIPYENKEESAFIQGIDIYPVKTLAEAADVLSKASDIKTFSIDIKEAFKPTKDIELDFSDVKGQYQGKRGLEIACAGNHNVLMIGPPGCGKTMMARRMPSIMPLLSLEEAIETTKIYSISDSIPKDEFLIKERPFRSPHHTSSDIAIIGGGHYPKPGEVSLSHNGILFLDEIAEFKKNVLQVLREPLEEEKVSISRAEYSVRFPSRFMLVATMNPCPCGYLTHPDIKCRCTALQKKFYLSKISGPLFDRIDIQLELNKVSVDELSLSKYNEESSLDKRDRITSARDRQIARFKNESIYSNSQMTRRQIEKYCNINSEIVSLLRKAIVKMNLSARAYDKILKLSRTIADLDDRDQINDFDTMEALQYRQAENVLKV